MPESDPAEAMTACRTSFNEFWDKLLAMSEADKDHSVVAMFVKLIKSMFTGLPDIYTHEASSWTYPSDIVEATLLFVVGSDLVGDGATFGILLNEIECIARDRPVTTEFLPIEGGTYGELLRMTAARFLLETLKEDEEVLRTQSWRIQLASKANYAAGLTGPLPYRPGVSEQHYILLDQLRQYWLNEAGVL